MGKKLADLLIKFGADTYAFTAATVDIKKKINGVSKDLQGFGKSMSLYFTAPLTAAAGTSVHLADVQMQAEQRLLTALKGRGDAQKQLIKQAGELQSRSTLGDEVIIGQQAFLASLGMTERQINDVIEASAQLSAAQGISLDSAVKNLAKTYGGLTGELGKSIPAMKQFTVEQLKSGAAVDYVLNNYKGFAEAVANTGLGPLQQLKNSLGDLSEEIGTILMPAVQQLVGWLKDLLSWLQKLSPETKTTIVVVGGLVAAIGPLALGLGSILRLLPLIASGWAALTGPIGLVTLAIGAATAAFVGFNMYAEASARAKLSARAQEIVESGMSIDQLYTRRDKVKQQNLTANERYNAASARLNPMNSQSMASYALSLGDNVRTKDQQARSATWSYNELQAIDEAIRLKKTQITTDAPTIVDPNTLGQLGKTVGLIERLQQEIAALEQAKIKATSTFEIANLNKELEKTRAKLEDVQNAGQSDGVTNGIADPFSKGGIKPLAFDPNAINPPESDWSTARENFAANISLFQAEAAGLVMDLSASLGYLFADMAVAIGEGLGNILSGDGTFEDMLTSVGKMIGQFLKSLGAQLIELGTMVVMMKQAMKFVWANPWAAIAIGVAVVAVGSAMVNAFNNKAKKGVALANGGLAYGPTMALVGDNRGAGSDPEVIAPLSKLRQYGLGRQAIEFVGGQFKLSGSDLLLSIRREDARITYVNALQ